MSLQYDFAFGPTCAGLEAVVTEVYTAVEVEDSPVTLDSAGSAQLALDVGTYQAVVVGPPRDLNVGGVLNIPASLEAAMLAPVAP